MGAGPVRIRVLLRVALVALLATRIGLGGSPARAEENGSSAIARAWLEEARARAEAGDWSGAADLLEEARAEDSTDADVAYLSALADIKNGVSPARAMAELDAALSSGRFTDYSEREARLLKAELLVRARAWTKALSLLVPPPLGGPSGAALDADYLWIRARAFAGSGDNRAFAAELGEALRRFPEDPRFARLLFEREQSVPSSDEARALVDLVLSRLGRYATVDPELPVLAAPFMPAQGDRLNAVQAYRASGGWSAAATLRALEYGIIDGSRAAAELFGSSYPLRLADVETVLAQARSDVDRRAVASALAKYSGLVEVDRDGDGVVEERATLDAGLVKEWRLDPNQDGSEELRVSFAEGLPANLELKRSDLTLKVAYAAYPYCASVAFDVGDSTSTYAFAPEALSYAPLTMKVLAGSGKSSVLFPTPTGATAPTETACASSALNLAIEKKGSEELQSVQLERGIPVRRETYHGGRLYAVLDYDHGRPALERVDVNGDGRFRMERLYDPAGDGSADSILRVRIDTRGNGLFDYSEEERFPFRKEWDLDGNGSVDAVQYQLADGSLRREFSSRLDGRFDEALTIKDGRIISLSRNGRSPKLVSDANPSLRWIGSKPFDLGSNLPQDEGIYSYMGKRYRLVRVGNQAFAELLP